MSYLVDTNVLSELRKRERANVGVRAWFAGVHEDDIFLSVLVLGEIRRDIERKRSSDPEAALALDAWLTALVSAHGSRILSVTEAIAQVWGRMGIEQPLPVIDALLGATARVHGLTIVTRNDRDLSRTGAQVLNPFT